jgi:hypothetical protein
MAPFPSRYDLKFWRNSQFDFQVALENEDGSPVDLTGWAATLRIFDAQTDLLSVSGTVTPAIGTIDFSIPSASLDVGWATVKHEIAITSGSARKVYLYGSVTVVQP